jgi:hypothetical protein
VSERAGLLVRSATGEGFVSADVAESVVPAPTLSGVTGAPLDMALLGGRVLPVLPLGERTGTLLVCRLEGELVAFSGLEVDRAGFFTAANAGVLVDGRFVPDLDLAGELRNVERAVAEPRLGTASRNTHPEATR